MHLYQKIAERVDEWRKLGHPCAEYPAVGEILDWARDPETGSLRFLRPPQLRAVETYWYLRLVEKTAHISDLYEKFFDPAEDTDAYLSALGITLPVFKACNYNVHKLMTRLKTDDDFVAAHKMEALRETLTLAYPSYILALAMGAGKTILIGTIIATEFAMGMEYPDGDFVQNALVFAPGTTIVESLREIAQIPYAKILPPRLYTSFEQSVKLTFTRDGEKDIPIIRGSLFNIVVTNTEKIRIQKPTGTRARSAVSQLKLTALDEQKTEEANLRLQAIASLPHLAVFSDEAHHTFGQAMGEEIKRVRQTINYLHTNSPNLVCVVNTTGTPYYEKQPLKDVVIWYGLSQGISDNILKDVAENIKGYGFDSANAGPFVQEIVRDFFADYADVRLPNGAPAKLALYFPQNDDLNELRGAVELALTDAGQPTTIILKNTSESSKQEVDDFNRLSDPSSPHRVILLVNKGTEGWNCPSLFACALVRKLKSSNNFVLQAATRCLRQVVGNTHPARMYLSKENRTLLETQLQETYGETLSALSAAERESRTVTLTLRKLPLQPMMVMQTRRSVVAKANIEAKPLMLTQPAGNGGAALTRAVYTPAVQASVKKVLQQVGETEQLSYAAPSLDLYTAATDLAAVYRLPFWTVYNALCACYNGADVPQGHLDALAEQVEAQTRFYEVQEHQEEVALAIIKPSGFDRDEDGHYVTQISVSKAREVYLLAPEQISRNTGDYGFHFAPYNFDSEPEKSFFDQMLPSLNQHPDDVEDIYFTGGFTSGDKTDFFVEYQDTLGKWRSYTPDFLIHRKDGKWLIVEVKAKRYEDDALDGRNGRKANAVRRWQQLSQDQIRYDIFFAEGSDFTIDEIKPARRFVEGTAL